MKLFLEEDDTGGGSAFLQNVGLIGAGVLVNFDNPSLSEPAGVLAAGDVVAGPDFVADPTSGSLVSLTPGISVSLIENVGLGLPVAAEGPGPVYRLLIGDFLFTAGTIAGEMTGLTAMRTSPGSSDNVGADFPPTTLDSVIGNASATITVNGVAPVPEPGSVGLLLTGMIATLARARCRRN